MAPRVLIVGFRRGMAQALQQLDVPFAVWSSSPPKSKSKALKIVVSPISANDEVIESVVKNFAGVGPFTHIVAGTEAGVLPAAQLRKVWGLPGHSESLVLSCHDKAVMKELLFSQGVPMTKFMRVDESTRAEDVFSFLGKEVVLKERRSSGSRGIAFVKSAAELHPILGGSQIAESCIEGKEISVESFIRDSQICFTNITDYYSPKYINLLPARLDLRTQQKVLEINRQVIRNLGIRSGMTHLELYLTDKGPLFGEIALRPPGGYIMELLKMAYQFDPWEAMMAIELGLKFDFPVDAQATVAAFIFHPGEGRVEGITGKDSIEALPSVKRMKLKVKENDMVKTRTGVGQDVGYVWMERPTYSELVGDLEFVKEKFKIKVS